MDAHGAQLAPASSLIDGPSRLSHAWQHARAACWLRSAYRIARPAGERKGAETRRTVTAHGNVTRGSNVSDYRPSGTAGS